MTMTASTLKQEQHGENSPGYAAMKRPWATTVCRLSGKDSDSNVQEGENHQCCDVQ
jgi:hypothetical protein